MGEIKKRPFRHPRSYYAMFVFYSIIIILGGWLIIYLMVFETEESVYNEFANRKLIGDSGQRSAILIEQFLVRTFGRSGLVAGVATGIMAGVVELYKEITAYLRYKRKCKLYEAGLIQSVYDIYDDCVPVPLWHRFRNLFVKREKRDKYPKKREMRKKLKQYDKNNLNK